MKLSEKGLDFIKEVEGSSKTVYLDSGGAPTIGVGHLLTQSERRSGKIFICSRAVDYGNGLTDSQIEDLLLDDVSESQLAVISNVKAHLDQCQFDALVSFAFNVGNIAFEESTLLRKLNACKYEDVPTQMRRWVYDNGKKVKGLKNRREKEITLWKGEWNA